MLHAVYLYKLLGKKQIMTIFYLYVLTNTRASSRGKTRKTGVIHLY